MDISIYRELIIGVVVDVLYVLLSIVVFYLIAFIKRIVDEKKLELIKEIAIDAVFFAQQEGKKLVEKGLIDEQLLDDKKFEMALKHVTKSLNKRGIKVSETELKNIIESVLKRIKLEYPDLWYE